MIVLRKMRKDEYLDYCQYLYFIDNYSQEIIENYGHSLDFAIELAKKDLYRCFPDGLENSEHSLLCIDTEIDGRVKLMGYLWHLVKIEDKSTFIYDFYISNEYRGFGYGTQSILEFENQLKSSGINQIKLRVALHNERALKLYKDVGFEITGFNILKKIGE